MVCIILSRLGLLLVLCRGTISYCFSILFHIPVFKMPLSTFAYIYQSQLTTYCLCEIFSFSLYFLTLWHFYWLYFMSVSFWVTNFSVSLSLSAFDAFLCTSRHPLFINFLHLSLTALLNTSIRVILRQSLFLNLLRFSLSHCLPLMLFFALDANLSL